MSDDVSPEGIAPQEMPGDLGLTHFQEMMAGIVCTVLFILMSVQILVRSTTRQSTLQATRKKPLHVLTAGLNKEDRAQNEIAEHSLQTNQEYTRRFIPYTGRRVPGLINMDADAARNEEMMRHSESYDQWLDYREYARFIATVLRGESFKLSTEGVLQPFPVAQECLTLRDVLDHLTLEAETDPKLLPETVTLEDDVQWRTTDAVEWLCDTYDRWRFGLRPGGRTATGARLDPYQTEVQREEVHRFRVVSGVLVRHLQQLTLRCVLCDAHRRDMRFEPCDHVCVCAQCAGRVAAPGAEFLCPVCGVQVATTVPVRASGKAWEWARVNAASLRSDV